MPNKIKKLIIALLLVVLVGASYGAGYVHGHGNIVFEKGFRPKIVNKELGEPSEVDFSLFWEVFNKIEQDFVGDFDRQKAVYGAIDGIARSVNDPYTVFLEPGLTEDFKHELSGELEGVGTEIGIRNKVLTIISPIEGSPSDRAGLKPKDQILKIDNQETERLTLSEAVSRIRGQSGTEVTLTIFRLGVDKPFDVKIVREKIKIDSARWTYRDDGLIHLKLAMFNEDTASLIGKLARELENKQAPGLILDLRNNPGGHLGAAIDVASYFIEEGKVVAYQKDKSGDRISYEAHSVPQKSLQRIPLIILVNEGSASASEIVAGALLDNNRSRLVGEKTFGKGSVQDFQEFKNGSSIRVTIAKWFTPKEVAINGEGIQPEFEVKISDEDEKADRDPQLDKAVELLKEVKI